MRTLLATLVVSLFIVPFAPGQTYTVKHDGSGDFTDLQTALDSVPAGATLLVYGDSSNYGAIVIRQSVAIVGASDSQPIIGGWSPWYDPNQRQPGIEVTAASDSTVVLENVYVAMVQDETSVTLGIIVDSVGTFVVDRCTVQAANANGVDPMGNGWVAPSALFVSGSASTVAVLRSTLLGAKGTDQSNVGDNGQCYGNGTVIGGPGGHALDVVNASLVVVSDSTLIGGTGGDAYWQKDYGCGDSPPIELRGGDGGNGVNGSAFVSNCTFAPGSGGGYIGASGQNGTDGVEVSGQRNDLPNLLAVSGNVIVGGSVTLTGAGFSPFRAALVFFSTSIGTPVAMRQGTWFLGFPFVLAGIVTTDVAGSFTVGGSLPNDPSLVGASIALQVADTEHLSEPELLIVGQ